MTLLYDRNFHDQIQTQLADYVINPTRFQGYEIEFPNGVGDPPVLEIARVMDQGSSFENKVLMTRYCIKSRQVKVKLNGEYVDPGFQMNSLTDDFDNVSTFKLHPMALNILIDTCMDILIKKYLPSLISIDQVKVE